MSDEIKITEVEALKLEPGKAYVLIFSKEAVAYDKMAKLSKILRDEYNVDIKVGIGVAGKVGDAFKLIEDS
jgi:GTP cyclohydrolase III